MKISLDVGENPRLWENMLNFFVNQCMHRSFISGSNLPDLYNSRITYKRETGEYWQRPEETHALGYGDCEDLSIYRVCELRRRGVPARCVIRRSRNNPHQYHCIVQVFPGITEDPSALRGMYGYIPGLAGEETPGMMPGAMPGMMPGAMPGMMPGAMPGMMPGAMPGMMPGAMPGMMPGAMPGMMPGMNPLMMSPYGAMAMMALPVAQQGYGALKSWWKRRKQRGSKR